VRAHAPWLLSQLGQYPLAVVTALASTVPLSEPMSGLPYTATAGNRLEQIEQTRARSQGNMLPSLPLRRSALLAFRV
jgi:hypothetical protein